MTQLLSIGFIGYTNEIPLGRNNVSDINCVLYLPTLLVAMAMTKLDELLSELRTQFVACLQSGKGCEDFQVDCWALLIRLEKEAERLNNES